MSDKIIGHIFLNTTFYMNRNCLLFQINDLTDLVARMNITNSSVSNEI